MTDEVKTEQQEEDVEVLNIFNDDFDDKALASEDDPTEGTEGNADPDTGTPDDELPEKYRGKSIRDVVEMHQNLEKAYGRHNNELGELRQLTDQILKQQLESTAPKATTTELDPDSLLENPTEALNKAIDSNPTLASIQAKLIARERAEQLSAFKKVHPDAEQLVNDPRFVAWIKESPTRMNLFAQADQNYDYELASELLNVYKQLEPNAGVERTSTARRQMTSPSKNAGQQNAGAKKQVFRRADLMRLKAEDPDRYERLQPQILQAYQEGRVK